MRREIPLIVTLILFSLTISGLTGRVFADLPSDLEQAKSNIISLIQQRNYAEAQEQTQKFLAGFAGYPDLPETLYWIAEEYRWKGKSDQAKDLYQQIIQNFSGSPYADKAQMAYSRTEVLSLIASNKLEQAEKALDKLVTDFSGHPDLPETLFWIAEEYKWSGRYEQAKSIHQQVIQNYPDSSWAGKAKLGLSMIDVLSLIVSGNYSQAEKTLDKLVADFSGHPDLPEVLYRIADGYKWSGRYEQAKSVFKQVIQNYPDSSCVGNAKLGLSMTDVLSLIVSGNYSQAEESLDKLVADFSGHPDLPEVLYRIADGYKWSNRYEDANNTFQQVIQNYPDSPCVGNAKLGLSMTDILSLIVSRNYEQAKEAFDKLVKDFSGHPELPDTLYWIAQSYRWSFRYEDAKSIYQQILKNSPDSQYAIKAQVGLATVDVLPLVERGDDAAVGADVNNLIADFNDNPNLPEAIFQIGEQYYNKALADVNEGRNDQADANFVKTVSVWERIIQELPSSPATPQAYWCSAVVYSQELDKYQKGIEYYQQVVDNWPNYQYAWHAQFFIGTYYEKLRDSGGIPESEANPKIEQAYKAVVEKYPDSKSSPYAALKLGQLNFNRGQWADAAEYFEIFLQKSPNDPGVPGVLYDLGRAYEKMGDLSMAAEMYRIFIEMADPNDQRIKDVKAELEKLEGATK